MPLQIDFPDQINTSVQPGDLVFYIPTATGGSGFTTGQVNTSQLIGTVLGVFRNTPGATPGPYITVANPNPNLNIPPGAFIMFSKNEIVNQSKVLGYYTKVKFENWSSEKIELFSVGSEFSLSSK